MISSPDTYRLKDRRAIPIAGARGAAPGR